MFGKTAGTAQSQWHLGRFWPYCAVVATLQLVPAYTVATAMSYIAIAYRYSDVASHVMCSVSKDLMMDLMFLLKGHISL